MIKSHAQFVFGAGWHREGLIHGHRCILWMDGRIWTVTLDLSLPFEQPWAKASLERVSISEGWCWRPDRYWLVKLMWPSNWADGSRWCCVGGPQHLSSFLPTMSASQPPFVLPIPAGYFYHGGKKWCYFSAFYPETSHTSSLEKAPNRWLWSLVLRKTANLLGCRQAFKILCIMQKEWLQTPLFRMA